MNTLNKIILLILFCFIIGQGVYATITATYTPTSSVVFKLGNKIAVDPSTPLGTFSSDKLVAYLGTIKITKGPTDKYYRPLMTNFGSAGEFRVVGKITGWGGGVKETGFYTFAHNSMLSQPYRLYLDNAEQPLYAWDNNTEITPNPYYINIFLVSHEGSHFYIEDEVYQIVSGTLGSFNIKVLKSQSPWVEEYISVNNQEMPPGGGPPISDPIPLPIGGSGELPPEIPYGEEPPPLNFIFSFQNNTVSFDLSEAYGENNKKTINVAQMNVQNGVAGTTYKQNLTFTDSGSAQSFQLKPVGVSGNTIGFKLYFGNSSNAIPYGQAFEWTGLVPNMNYKDLKIGGILESEVNQCTSGSYSDTITVTVTAAN